MIKMKNIKTDGIISRIRELTEEVYEVVVDGIAKRRRRYFNIDLFRDHYEYRVERAKPDDGNRDVSQLFLPFKLK